MKTNTTNTTNTNLIRANKLTVKTLDNGHLQADFSRTHKHILSVLDSETGYVPDTKLTKSAIREGFRAYVAEHAAELGINYDPEDRRTEANLRKATYANEADVALDAIAMVTPDIEAFITKMPHGDLVDGFTITVDSLTAKTQTSKGTDLALMGIEDGKYLSNGNLAWFDIEGTVTMTIKTADTADTIYQTIKMELVSGQLKKFRMTQTQWNTETTKSMVEAGLVEEKPKAEKSAKGKTDKVGLGDEEHEGLHMDMTPEEEAKSMAEAEEYLKKTAKKSRKSKKSEEKVEG